jgi:sugar transferase (PEP-CTERM/EpsH1 system associated)
LLRRHGDSTWEATSVASRRDAIAHVFRTGGFTRQRAAEAGVDRALTKTLVSRSQLDTFDTAAKRVAPRRPGLAGVVHVVLNLDPGGTERLVIQLARQLADRFQPLVCCLDNAGQWAPEIQRAGVEVIALERRPGFHPSLGRKLARIAADRDVRILHCHHYSPFVYGAIAMACRPGLRVVYTEHGRLSDAPPTRKRRLVNPCLGLLPDRIYAVSRDLRAHMIAEGLPARRIDVIHNGIEPGRTPAENDRRAARVHLGIPDASFVVGTVARLDQVKDLRTLIAAFRNLSRTIADARLVVIGDGPERAALREAAHDAGVADRVVLAGYRSDAREMLAAFDVFANSSISEGVSLTILEAMAASLPVVATAVGGTPEVVLEQETGLLVSPRDPERMATALRAMAGAPAFRRSLGAAGRRRVETFFTLERMVQAYEQAYTELDATGLR